VTATNTAAPGPIHLVVDANGVKYSGTLTPGQ
jgi:hypothetical protein